LSKVPFIFSLQDVNDQTDTLVFQNLEVLAAEQQMVSAPAPTFELNIEHDSIQFAISEPYLGTEFSIPYLIDETVTTIITQNESEVQSKVEAASSKPGDVNLGFDHDYIL
jgi:hypothetical protein